MIHVNKLILITHQKKLKAYQAMNLLNKFKTQKSLCILNKKMINKEIDIMKFIILKKYN